MHEIKLRVRDSETKKILGYEIFNSFNGFYWYYSYEEDPVMHTIFSDPPMLKPKDPFSHLVREQYINIDDIDGREIYEGDTLKYYIAIDFEQEFYGSGYIDKPIYGDTQETSIVIYNAELGGYEPFVNNYMTDIKILELQPSTKGS